MSLISTGLKDAVGALFSSAKLYIYGGIAVAIIGLFIWGRVEWHNSVTKAAQVRIDQYIATQKKDAEEIKKTTDDNTKQVEIRYVDRVQTITKVVHDTKTIIETKVPDVKTILSDGWVSTYNASVQGLAIDPVAAAVATPSGVNATEALDTVNDNNGQCLAYVAQIEGLQTWITTTKAQIDAQNKKDGAKKK